MRNKLQLNVLGKETVVIRTFGKETSTATDIEVVGLKNNGVSRGIIIEAFVFANICSDLINHNTKLVSESYSHLRRLYLADNVSQGTMPVDILIGLD